MSTLLSCPQTSGKPFYTSRDLAAAVGVCTNTARNYLRWRYPQHEPESWWRLNAVQFERSKAHLHQLKARNPSRPLQGLGKTVLAQDASTTHKPGAAHMTRVPIRVSVLGVIH